jgi:nicotinamidase-related amidase
MPVDMMRVMDGARSALVVNEMQSSMVGPDVEGPMAAAGRAVLPNIVRLVEGARHADVPVIHCLKIFRRDGVARNRNIVLYKRRDAASAPLDRPPIADSRPVAGTEVHPALGPDERDVVVSRLHGMSSISDTGVDPLLRTLGVDTVVVTGISVNIGVTNVTMDLVNRGYDVIVPRDAIGGTPASFTDLAIEHILRYLATITTTDDLLGAWGHP